MRRPRSMRSTKVWLNGRKAKRTELRAMAHALSDCTLLQEKGGYLFKAVLHERILHIGVVPVFSEGVRGHHYEITLPGEEYQALSGTVSPGGFFTILFHPRSTALSSTDKQQYRMTLSAFARCLVDSGLNTNGVVDEITRDLFVSSGLMSTAPDSLRSATKGEGSGTGT